LDKKTVTERIKDLCAEGFCSTEPPQIVPEKRVMPTGIMVIPSDDLLERYDRHLMELIAQVYAVAKAINRSVRKPAVATLERRNRELALDSLYAYSKHWANSLDGILDERKASRARRKEIMENLMAASHWAIMQMAIEHHYGVSAIAAGEANVMADGMAAALYGLSRQPIARTREHISYLIENGFLTRHPYSTDKALRVTLSSVIAPHIHQALGHTAKDLVEIARKLAGAAPPKQTPPAKIAKAVGATKENERGKSTTFVRRSAPKLRVVSTG